MNSFDSIAITKVVLFSFYLPIAVYLCFKHGWSLNDGWVYLVILAVANFLGSFFLLASINNPSNQALIRGWTVLNSVGLGMLLVVLLGLLERIFSSINRDRDVVVKPLYRRLIDTLMLVAMITSIVGGFETKRTDDSIKYSATSDASMGLMIAVVSFLCVEIYYLVRKIGLVPQGERRTFAAIIVALPFLIVRLAYSCLLTFGDRLETFDIYLGMCVISEMIVVLICEVVGFALSKAAPPHKRLTDDEPERQRSES